MTQRYAKFWEVDLHTHTPASADVDPDRYGAATPEEFVAAAVSAGLDAVAVTDHNIAAWCDKVAAAAEAHDLVVLPGVEISTTEGHLLGIWEEGTPSSQIGEVLVRLGIRGEDQGKLDISAEVGFSDAAREIAQAAGLAIAAHVDRPKGLLKLSVAAHVKRTLADQDLAAVEIVHPDTREKVLAKVAGVRSMACIRSSDCTKPGESVHVLDGLGSRRTWVKAARPDLVGIRHALQDPELRVALEDPHLGTSHPQIQSITFSGGFLDGTQIHLSPDLTCLLGGTGAGKSLALEAIRYALDQQVDRQAFPHIWEEVRSRMVGACGASGVIRLVLTVSGDRFSVERVVGANMDGVTTVQKKIGSEWADVDLSPRDIVELNAFSQGEVLEYSRQPVGRMSLVDASLDLDKSRSAESVLVDDLGRNAESLLSQRDKVEQLRDAVSTEGDLVERVDELTALFNHDAVKQQQSWKTESSLLGQCAEELESLLQSVDLPEDAVEFKGESVVSSNKDLFKSVSGALVILNTDLKDHQKKIVESIAVANKSVTHARSDWDKRFAGFKEFRI